MAKEQDEVLAKVKKLMTENPVLAYYDPHSESVVECDASERGLGVALLQNGKPIGYAMSCAHQQRNSICSNRERMSDHCIRVGTFPSVYVREKNNRTQCSQATRNDREETATQSTNETVRNVPSHTAVQH